MLTSSIKRSWALLPQYSPYLAFVMIFAWYSSSSVGWQAFLFSICVLVSIAIPIVVCKQISLNSSGKTSWLWWFGGFAGLPLLHLLLHENLDGYEALLNDDLVFFLWLIAIELIMLVLKHLKPIHLAGLKQKLTMDNIVFGIVIFFSLLWSLVFNSVDEPMQNQPINVLIDIKRNGYVPINCC